MFKLIVLAKRRPGMTREEFRDYYEKHHAVLVRNLTPLMRKYRRNYLAPLTGTGPLPGTEQEPPFDCVTEAWFDRAEDFQRTVAQLAAQPEKTAALASDEEQLFDRATIRMFAAHEAD